MPYHDWPRPQQIAVGFAIGFLSALVTGFLMALMLVGYVAWVELTRPPGAD
jgi:hypothetical protein